MPAFTLQGFETPEQVQQRIGKAERAALVPQGDINSLIYQTAAQGQAGLGNALLQAGGYEDPQVVKARQQQDILKDVDFEDPQSYMKASQAFRDAGDMDAAFEMYKQGNAITTARASAALKREELGIKKFEARTKDLSARAKAANDAANLAFKKVKLNAEPVSKVAVETQLAMLAEDPNFDDMGESEKTTAAATIATMSNVLQKRNMNAAQANTLARQIFNKTAEDGGWFSGGTVDPSAALQTLAVTLGVEQAPRPKSLQDLLTVKSKKPKPTTEVTAVPKDKPKEKKLTGRQARAAKAKRAAGRKKEEKELIKKRIGRSASRERG